MAAPELAGQQPTQAVGSGIHGDGRRAGRARRPADQGIDKLSQGRVGSAVIYGQGGGLSRKATSFS